MAGTRKRVKKNELPAAVLNASNTQYAGYKMEEAAEIEKSDFKSYELAIENGNGE